MAYDVAMLVVFAELLNFPDVIFIPILFAILMVSAELVYFFVFCNYMRI